MPGRAKEARPPLPSPGRLRPGACRALQNVWNIPGDDRPVEFQNMRTSVASILVHAVVFVLLLLALQQFTGIGTCDHHHHPKHL
eukprot:SM000218S06590  [mRNA]  locus=s218:33953:34702:+ [translate_table: standard]